MSNQKKITSLLLVLIAGGTLVGLGARSTGQDRANTPASETGALFLGEGNPSDPVGPAFGNRELFFKMLLSIALVAVLGIAALYVSKKILPKVTNLPGKEIRVVETAYLGPRKMLHLVQVGNQKLLVGSTNETIATLAHIDDAWLDMAKQEVDSAMNL